MSEYVDKRECHQGPGQINREAFFIRSSSLPSPNTVHVSTTTTNQRFANKTQLRGSLSSADPAKQELQWWLHNLELYNGKSLLAQTPIVIQNISLDASKNGWGAFCQGQRTAGPWSRQERDLHINTLELKAVNIALRTFTDLSGKERYSRSYRNGQHDSSVISCQNSKVCPINCHVTWLGG